MRNKTIKRSALINTALRKFRIHYPLFLGFLLCLTSIVMAQAGGNARGRLAFSDIPDSFSAGQGFHVNLHYQYSKKDPHERFVAILFIKSGFNGQALDTVILDNNGQGFDAPQGTLIFPVKAPVNAPEELFMSALLAPYSLNDHVVNMLQSYPRDGTHPYRWKGGSTGHTRDLFYQDKLLAEKQKGGSTYCCGITFEVFLRAYQEYNEALDAASIGDISFDEMKKFRGEWYGSRGDTVKQMVTAMSREEIGIEIVNKETARTGDFCMFWRHNGSGHSVIFIDWVRDASGRITGLRYWSAQKSTKGIGYREESFGPPRGLDWNKTFIGRLKKPRDASDWEQRIAAVHTPMPLLRR